MLRTTAVCTVGFFISRIKDFLVNELVQQQRSCPEDLNRHQLDQAFEDRQFGPAPRVWEPRALRVLVIEDDSDTAESMARLIKLWGHDVRQATSARAGLNEAFTYRPDFVLLDLGMPMMNGCSLARQVRLDPRLRGCFIVAITGYGDAEQRRRAYDAGINLFLVKPVDTLVLETVLSLEGKHVG